MKNLSMVKVWDPFVRVFHWALVTAFLLAYVTEEELLGVHSWAGYIVLALVASRIIWGFIGPRYARFSSFVFSWPTVKTYLKQTLQLRAPRYLGHNPAGGLMVVALLLSLIVTGITGMAVYGAEGAGPLGTLFSGAGEFLHEALEETHEFFANFTVVLIIAHVGGVVIESLIHRENLVDAMVTGNKPLRATEQEQ